MNMTEISVKRHVHINLWRTRVFTECNSWGTEDLALRIQDDHESSVLMDE